MGILSKIFKKQESEQAEEYTSIIQEYPEDKDTFVNEEDFFSLQTRPYGSDSRCPKIFFPQTFKGLKFARKFDSHRLCIITDHRPDYRKLHLFENLMVLQDPYNKYDQNAIAFYSTTQKIGYVYRNGFQDILNEKLNAGFLAVATIIYLDGKNDNIDVEIALYKR